MSLTCITTPTVAGATAVDAAVVAVDVRGRWAVEVVGTASADFCSSVTLSRASSPFSPSRCFGSMPVK